MQTKLIILFLFFVTSNLCYSQYTIILKPKKSVTTYRTEKTLIVVNDSILKYEVMAYLNPNDIASVMVWKDEKAIELYGDKGKFGEIAITTKNISKRKLRKIYKEFKDLL